MSGEATSGGVVRRKRTTPLPALRLKQLDAGTKIKSYLSWPSAQRLENPRHSPTLRQLEKAAALDKRLVLALE